MIWRETQIVFPELEYLFHIQNSVHYHSRYKDHHIHYKMIIKLVHNSRFVITIFNVFKWKVFTMPPFHDKSLILRFIKDAAKRIGFNTLSIYKHTPNNKITICIILNDLLKPLCIISAIDSVKIFFYFF